MVLIILHFVFSFINRTNRSIRCDRLWMVHRAEAAGPVSTHNTWDMPSPAGPAWHVWRWFKCVVWLPGQEWVANMNIQRSIHDEMWLIFLLWDLNDVKRFLFSPQMKRRNMLSLSLRMSSHSQIKSHLRKFSQRWASVITSAVFQLSCHLKKPVTDWSHTTVPKNRRWVKTCS